ncbi:MAG: 50S ribosomal protein L15 [Chloroflexi bacterium]|nr:50S ribosomal protein L15 [Chloroflexota bacterium]
MKPHELAPPGGAHRRRRRVGRGSGSGRGNYSGRGIKGQKSRTGGKVGRGFSGGQLKLVKALPKLRGFTNIFRHEYAEVNVERLAQFPAGSRVTPEGLKEAGILRDVERPVKVLGRGRLKQPLTVVAHRFSRGARAVIEAAGGKVEEL